MYKYIYIYGDSISCGICRNHHIVDTYVILSLYIYRHVEYVVAISMVIQYHGNIMSQLFQRG